MSSAGTQSKTDGASSSTSSISSAGAAAEDIAPDVPSGECASLFIPGRGIDSTPRFFPLDSPDTERSESAR